MKNRLDSVSAVRHEGLAESIGDVISSLADDATALRGMSSLLAVARSGDDHALHRWDQLNHAVGQMEEKVDLLRGIVRAEQQALQNLERLGEEADRRKNMIQLLREQSQKRKVLSKHDENVPSPSFAVVDSKPAASPLSTTTRRRDSLDPRSQQAPPTTPHRRHSSIPMQRITLQQLEEVPRTIRGRISLPVMNDAVSDIERAISEKYNSKKSTRSPWQQLAEEDEPDEVCISEQDLRQTCAFFRSGEATARVILMILRTLGRLKQVPRKDGHVVYTLPTSGVDE